MYTNVSRTWFCNVNISWFCIKVTFLAFMEPNIIWMTTATLVIYAPHVTDSIHVLDSMFDDVSRVVVVRISRHFYTHFSIFMKSIECYCGSCLIAFSVHSNAYTHHQNLILWCWFFNDFWWVALKGELGGSLGLLSKHDVSSILW